MSRWTIPGVLLTLVFLLGGVWTALREETGESVFYLREIQEPVSETQDATAVFRGPDAEENDTEESTEQVTSRLSARKININTADAAALTQLPGIGTVKAEAIVAFREAHGAFASPEAIMQVPGIKEGTFARLSGCITVEDP